MPKSYDCSKIMDYAENAAWEALDAMRQRNADLRNPNDREAVKTCLKIIGMTAEAIPAQSAAMHGYNTRSYADGQEYGNGQPYGDMMDGSSSARSRHLVRAHYSMGDGAGNTLSRMMDAASPRERAILEDLLRKIDD